MRNNLRRYPCVIFGLLILIAIHILTRHFDSSFDRSDSSTDGSDRSIGDLSTNSSTNKISANRLSKYCYNSTSNSIVFIHSTNQSDAWKRLESCAFRRAALLNHPTGVCVLTMIDMEPHPNLIGLPNLEFARLDAVEILNGTPVFDWYVDSYLNSKMAGKFAQYELTDLVRYAYLWKYGGYYLDTDVITLRNFTHLRNTTASQGGIDDQIAIGVMFFDRKHPLIHVVLEEASKSYDPNEWGTFGPRLMTRVIRSGRVSNHTYTLLSTEFYPTTWTEPNLPFMASGRTLMEERTKGSYTLHLWRARMLMDFDAENYWEDGKELPRGSFVEEMCRDV